MRFTEESKFEEVVIDNLIRVGWSKDVIKYPTEKDLLKNWANILFKNNRQKERLNECKLTESEMQKIMEQIRNLESPIKLNEFINGESIAIIRDNEQDELNFGNEVSLKLYDRLEIAGGETIYQIVQQPKFTKSNDILPNRRGDLMLLINGMPVIHIELKKSAVSINEACYQIQKYTKENVFTGIFSLIQIFVAMNPDESVYFANPGNHEKFNPAYYFHWADVNNNRIDAYNHVISSFLSITMVHNLIGFYTIADTDEGVLKVMRSYQYYAAKGIARKVFDNNWVNNNQLGGYIWHTTGSGKTLTSFKSAQLIAASSNKGDRKIDKVIFLVDRIELDIQSLKEYRSVANENEEVQSTENTNELITKLTSKDFTNTLIVTSIQKLSNIYDDMKSGRNENDLKTIKSKKIVIIIDECHRSTFGEMLARIKDTFKNSLIFGFTGTPIQEVNIKKDSTTATLFGDEIHRYTLADGINDKNVLGFDPISVKVYTDLDLRENVALDQAKAKSVEEALNDLEKSKIYYYFMDNSKVKMYSENVDGKFIKGIEGYLPNAQYETDKYRKAVVKNIKERWNIYSRNNKFHAIFATSSIKDAIIYYRLIKEKIPELKVTAIFDSQIDNDGFALSKEDGIIEILNDYNKRYSTIFNLSNYNLFKKEVGFRLSHKKPYNMIKKEDQIDLVIVVNQMLTGFDSKWVNTLYLDKMLDYQNLIQAFSRTNRIFDEREKPFGIIKYYRRPNTMEKNIEKAVKAYSGDIPTGLFVDKLPKNLKNMNIVFEEIKNLFDNATYNDKRIENFENLPDMVPERIKFAQLFKAFNRYLEAATIQGFNWKKLSYEFIKDESNIIINVELDEHIYNTLLARYRELAKPKGIILDSDRIPYDIDTRLIENSNQKIDADYMNEKFDKYIKVRNDNCSDEEIAKTLKELNRSYTTLSKEEQECARKIISDIELNIPNAIKPGLSFSDQIALHMKERENIRIDEVVFNLGCDKEKLVKLYEMKLNKNNLQARGKFQSLIDSVDEEKAKEYFKRIEKNYISHYLDSYIYDYLENFLTTHN